jgi:PAS domain S-box-containing protein
MVPISPPDGARDAGYRHPMMLDTILDTMPALVVVLDRHGRIVRFNRACEELTGFTEAELVGRPIWEVLIAPDELDSVQRVFGALMAGHRHPPSGMTGSRDRANAARSSGRTAPCR